jgi:hypothetical protein
MSSKLLLLVGGVLLMACGGEPQEGQEPEPSELVVMMRNMETQMYEIREAIAANKDVSDMYTSYESMFWLPASDHIGRDTAFMIKGSQFMTLFRQTTTAPEDSVQYLWGKTIEGCVDCHSDYCPGPIKRIRKLHL